MYRRYLCVVALGLMISAGSRAPEARAADSAWKVAPPPPASWERDRVADLANRRRAVMEQIGDLQSEIGELQSKIGEVQSRAGDQQSKLGELQGQLGEKQGKLGEQQGELGRQQAELAEKAARQMKELIDDAIKNGTAKPEGEVIRSPTL